MLAIYGSAGDHGHLEAHANFEIIRLSLFKSKKIVTVWNELEASVLLNTFVQMRRAKEFYFTKKYWDVVSANMINDGFSDPELVFTLHVEKIMSGRNKKLLTKRYMNVAFEESLIKFLGQNGREGGGSFSLSFKDFFQTWV